MMDSGASFDNLNDQFFNDAPEVGAETEFESATAEISEDSFAISEEIMDLLNEDAMPEDTAFSDETAFEQTPNEAVVPEEPHSRDAQAQPSEEKGDAKKDSENETPAQKRKRILSIVWKVVFFCRKIVLAVPVVWSALKLAAYNRENLPEQVGINLQSTGEFAMTISQETAVNVPLLITFGCLALMVISRKTIYPWLISLFTLVLPILLFLTNGYLG